MTTLVRKSAKPGLHVKCGRAGFTVCYPDGRAMFVPWRRHWRLSKATAAQRRNVEVDRYGLSLRWPDVDEDLEVAALARADARPAPPPR